ncbi:MAG TPA: hypothetical protein VFZ80_02825 [Acidimicrobiia bacterium]
MELIVGVGVATWVAHLYAEVLGNHVRSVDAFRPHALRRAMTTGYRFGRRRCSLVSPCCWAA